MLIQDNTVLEGKLPHFGGKTPLLPNATADCQEWRSVSNATAGTRPWRLLTVTPLRAAAVASHVVDARAHVLQWRRRLGDAVPTRC